MGSTGTPPPPPPPLIPPIPLVDETLFSLPKVKLPFFDGSDTRGWVTKAELYFKVHHTPLSQQLYLAQMCMDGQALHWFTNLLICHPTTTWDQFRTKLLHRFSGTRFRNAHEALGLLFQEGGVDEYIAKFEELTALIPNQSEEESIGWYLRGLKPEIRIWVRTLYPLTCDQAMEFSKNVEMATGMYNGKPANKHRSVTSTVTLPNLNSSPRPTYSPSPVSPYNPKPFSTDGSTFPRFQDKAPSNIWSPTTRSLSKQEWDDRRCKGLCFTCGLKYTPQHKCAKGSLRVLLLPDGDEVDETSGGEPHDDSPPDDVAPDGECSSLEPWYLSPNLNPTLSTIKIAGEINNLPALILVDNGATHNFISRRLAIALGLTIHSIPRVAIKLGDDRKVWMTEQCQDISIKLGSFSCVLDALVYKLGSLDVILGIAWLRTLDDVLCNWLTRRIQFWDGSTLIQLQGLSHTE